MHPRDRRREAALRYKPDRVKLLLVAEVPPAAPDRYFYFEDVWEHDSLFRYVARSILSKEPTRGGKATMLAELRDRGVFLIDLKLDPVDGTPLSECVPDLIARVKKLAPEKIILIKATVYDAAYLPLVEAGLPVAPERIPFPGSGQQKRFEQEFARSLS